MVAKPTLISYLFYMGKIFLALPLLITLLSCTLKDFQVDENLSYYKGDDYELFLDIAWPTNNTGPHPALVYIYGSGWGYNPDAGRFQFFDSIKEAAQNGYVAATMDHRVTNIKENGIPLYQFPSQLEDVELMFKWLRANSKKYNIDTDRIGMIGWSSGGHLALLYSFSDDSNPPVKAVVNMSAPVDLALEYRISRLAVRPTVNFMGGPPEEMPERYDKANPINYISPGDPPVLMLYGGADQIVPLDHGVILEKALINANVPCKLIVEPDRKHERYLMDELIWNFLDGYLK